jgi:hypothetical protein
LHVLGDLPEIMDKTRKNAESLNQVAEDVQLLRAIAGADRPGDETLPGYVKSVLDYIEENGGRVGLFKNPLSKGLRDGQPAREWVKGRRQFALGLAVAPLTRNEFLNAFCGLWLIEDEKGEAVLLKKWLRANHPASMALK